MVETARLYWTDSGAGITMDLLPGTIGVILIAAGSFAIKLATTYSFILYFQLFGLLPMWDQPL